MLTWLACKQRWRDADSNGRRWPGVSASTAFAAATTLSLLSPWAVALASASEAPAECAGLPRRIHIDAEGLDFPEVEGSGEASDETVCKVAWRSHREISAPGAREMLLHTFDFVFTDSLATVPFAGRDGKIAFMERVDQIVWHPEPDELFGSKESLLSVLLPARDSEAWEQPLVNEIANQAFVRMPSHTYVDDGTPEMHSRAFAKYRFALIADEENHTVSQALVRCIGFQTVPVFIGFISLGVMMQRAIVPYNRSFFSLELLRATLPEINHDIGWLWQYHRMLQDQLIYRYSQSFEVRLRSAACTLCRLSRPARSPHAVLPGSERAAEEDTPPLALVGVYSAKANFDKRRAVRETWGRVFQEIYGIRVRFFLGRISSEPSIADEQVRREITMRGDIVVLDVADGYAMNAKKGLLFLEWCAKHAIAEFILKVDDDVYLRPAPVLAVLHKRPPFGYIWGYFDYLSPVPREAGQAFYNDEASFPFEAFPPYPRGLVRAMSLDVVRRIAAAGRREELHMIFGDDPCLGVHLRQLVFDKEDPVPLLALDDRDSYRSFAMEPSCLPHLWSHMTPRTWVVHHVTAEQLRCLWAADAAAGMYEILSDGSLAISSKAVNTAEVAASVSTAPVGAAPEVPPMPDTCECLRTGPLAEQLANRRDKINASRTYEMWGDPNAELE